MDGMVAVKCLDGVTDLRVYLKNRKTF